MTDMEYIQVTHRELPYATFDADNHMYETRDAMTKFLPPEYEGVIKYVEINGRTKLAIRDRISDYIPNPTFDVVARPGAMEDFFRKGNPEGKSRRQIFGDPMRAIPAFREPAARVELMDEQGIDRALMFPTLASLLEERMKDDPEMMHAVIHSLNQWIDETWTFDYQDRIFPTPVITLPIVDKAIELGLAIGRLMQGEGAARRRPAHSVGQRARRTRSAARAGEAAAASAAILSNRRSGRRARGRRAAAAHSAARAAQGGRAKTGGASVAPVA
jgi:hypothetical protein